MGELGREAKILCCRKVRNASRIPIFVSNFTSIEAIDYIQELNATRDDLLRRLAQTRATLSPDHPLLIPPGDPDLETGQTIPLWEREWTYSPDADDEGSEDEAN